MSDNALTDLQQLSNMKCKTVTHAGLGGRSVEDEIFPMDPPKDASVCKFSHQLTSTRHPSVNSRPFHSVLELSILVSKKGIGRAVHRLRSVETTGLGMR